MMQAWESSEQGISVSGPGGPGGGETWGVIIAWVEGRARSSVASNTINLASVLGGEKVENELRKKNLKRATPIIGKYQECVSS